MQIADLITLERIACDVAGSSKKRALERLSELIAQGEPLTATEVFDSLLARERLGGTGLGHGVAIPHGRLKNNVRTIGAFVRLEQGVDFDAIDNEPVDLLFALIVPEESTEEHLQVLALLARMFSDEKLRAQLRQAESAAQIHALLTGWAAD